MPLIECVPNFSNGRDPQIVDAIAAAIAEVPGTSVLHQTSDPWHNRSVITFAGSPDSIADSAFSAIRTAAALIDLRDHRGVHPRMGAADVVPFVPLSGASMDDCIRIAQRVGQRVGEVLEIPVYLYERSATRPDRQNLADVRRGGYEAIAKQMTTSVERAPDFGPSHIHPSAGAVAIGARPFLVAFNMYLGDASKFPHVHEHVHEIAKAIRASSGGMPGVKALALEVGGEAQLSMNLVDINVVTVPQVFDAVVRKAAEYGLSVTWSELIGLAPNRALGGATTASLRLRDSLDDHRLEMRLAEAGLPV